VLLEGHAAGQQVTNADFLLLIMFMVGLLT
jgi:hypothetical protein